MFEEYAKVIQERYPQISIHAANYPPPSLYKQLASFVNIAKWVSMGAIILGEKIQLWQNLNMPPPSAYTWAQEHKVLACFSLFFIGNSVEGSLVQTGAFEVELNGMPIWSKLKSGRVPQGSELFDIINNQMTLSKSEFIPPPGTKQFVPPAQEGTFSPDTSEEESEYEREEELKMEGSQENADFAEFDDERVEL